MVRRELSKKQKKIIKKRLHRVLVAATTVSVSGIASGFSVGVTAGITTVSKTSVELQPRIAFKCP